MWMSYRELFGTIFDTLMDDANEKAPILLTLMWSAVIFVLVANHAVRFSRGAALGGKNINNADADES